MLTAAMIPRSNGGGHWLTTPETRRRPAADPRLFACAHDRSRRGRSGAGATSCVVNLARALAAEGKRVLIDR